MRYTLELFKEHGYLVKSVEAAEFEVGKDVLTFSQYNALDDAAKRVCTLPVVVDAPAWFGVEGTSGKKRILSFSDKSRRLARWQEGTGKVGIYKITRNGFQLVENFQLLQVAERTENMEDTTQNTEKNEWNDFENAFNETTPENGGAAPNAGDGAAQNVNAFGNDGTGTGAGAGEKRTAANVASAIRSRTSNIQFDNSALASFTRRLGSLLFYVVGKDAAVKPTARMETKVVDGEIVFKPDVPEERRQKIVNKEIKANGNDVEREYNIRLVESKPTKVTDVVIALPSVVAAISPAEVWDQKGSVSYDSKNTTLVKKIYTLEQAFDVIQMYFGGEIYENKEVFGNKASTIVVDTRTRPGQGTEQDKVTKSLKVVKGSPRKQLVVRGTYFPRKLYDTVPLQNLSEENSELLNAGFSGIITRKASKAAASSVYDTLSADSKNKIHAKKDDNGNMVGYTFDFFEPGLANSSEVVYAFDNPDQQLADVRVPLRKLQKNKEGKVSYGFVTLDVKDARGPLSKPEYKEILGKAGISEDSFKEYLVAARPTVSKSQSQLDASTYIKIRYGRADFGVDFGKTTPVSELNSAIENAKIL